MSEGDELLDPASDAATGTGPKPRMIAGGRVRTRALDGTLCLASGGAGLGKILPPSQTSKLRFGGPQGAAIVITASDKVWQAGSSRREAAHFIQPAGDRS